jgi:hypothetical protein
MARSSNTRLKLPEPVDTDDLVTLWHGFLDADESVLPEGCELPDGSKLEAGAALVCGTCGESLGSDLASQVALSRGRHRS